MRHWSVKFQKIWNFHLKHRWYRLEQVHNFIVRGGNLILEISVFGIKTADTGREDLSILITNLLMAHLAEAGECKYNNQHLGTSNIL